MRCTFVTALAVAAFALGPASAQEASNWPSKPVRLIVPASAGGIADVMARLMGEALAKRLGQPFILDNIAGGASLIGTAAAAKAPPDGYTLLIAAIAPLGIVPHVRKVPYVVERDLAPVGIVSTQPHLLLVNPGKMAVSNLPEFIGLLKDNPAKYNYASSGAGQLNHLEMELLLLKSGTKMTHVPYKSSGDQATADRRARRRRRLRHHRGLAVHQGRQRATDRRDDGGTLSGHTRPSGGQGADPELRRRVLLAWHPGAGGHAQADHRQAQQGDGRLSALGRGHCPDEGGRRRGRRLDAGTAGRAHQI